MYNNNNNNMRKSLVVIYFYDSGTDETNINHLTTEVVVNGFYINGA